MICRVRSQATTAFLQSDEASLTCVAGEGVLGLGAAEQVVVGDHELGAGVPRLQLHLGRDALTLPLEGGDVGLLEAGVEAVL